MLSSGSDPRLLVIPKRLASVNKVLAVMSSKGGVGKTLISVLLSLALREKGFKTGLFDLDFTNPSTHIVLGVKPSDVEPIEEKGIIPREVMGVKYLSIVVYTGDKPTPLRGDAIDDVFRELLAITNWGELDYLVIDTPPGLSDEHLNILTYLGDKLRVVLVSTPSPLSIESTRKLVEVLRDGGYRVLGLVENMCSNKLTNLSRELGIDYLACIPYVSNLDSMLGSPDAIKGTSVWRAILSLADRIAGSE
ncbi:MAG: Mrp/NBP35 family ATP-binding protein [Thermoprotei archaeon]